MNRSIRRAAAAGTAAVFLLAAWLLYRQDFWSLRGEGAREAAIVEYASADPEDSRSLRASLHPVILFDEVIQGRRILVFTDSEIPGLLGNLQFRRGVLGGWQPLCARYGAGAVVQSDTLRGRDVRVVYGLNCPPEIARYRVQANPDNDATLMAEGDVTSPTFFHVHETDRDFFPSIQLYDASGVELDGARYLASDQSVPSPSIGSAETDLVYWFCAVILGVGWLVVRYIWEGPHEKTKAA